MDMYGGKGRIQVDAQVSSLDKCTAEGEQYPPLGPGTQEEMLVWACE